MRCRRSMSCDQHNGDRAVQGFRPRMGSWRAISCGPPPLAGRSMFSSTDRRGGPCRPRLLAVVSYYDRPVCRCRMRIKRANCQHMLHCRPICRVRPCPRPVMANALSRHPQIIAIMISFGQYPTKSPSLASVSAHRLRWHHPNGFAAFGITYARGNRKSEPRCSGPVPTQVA